MSKIKPTLPSGTRDFSPEQVAKRNYIFNTIRSVFERYGFQPIETPAMENLATLTGKYGEEGDQLIFKILNSGDFLKNVETQNFASLQAKQLTPLIAEKALRYDLTVPFARYVVQHQNEITFPFKRYQIQPVWRADRPQKGRYREFWQCDADVIGSDSLLNEVELIKIYEEVFIELFGGEFTININNRKVLTGIAESVDAIDRFNELCSILDKIGKVKKEEVFHELISKGYNEQLIKKFFWWDTVTEPNQGKIYKLRELLVNSKIGLTGLEEVEKILGYLDALNTFNVVNFDFTLARGLNYYTGTIMEAKINNVQIGSVGGGGRYDDLTGMFGLPNVSGVGISFGADRIYDAMEELKLFPENTGTFTKVLFTNFDAEAEKYALPLLQTMRQAGINAEIYPSSEKLKKQMKYADGKKISFVVLIGSEEMQSGKLTLKNMQSGEQEKLTIEEIIKRLT